MILILTPPPSILVPSSLQALHWAAEYGNFYLLFLLFNFRANFFPCFKWILPGYVDVIVYLLQRGGVAGAEDEVTICKERYAYTFSIYLIYLSIYLSLPKKRGQKPSDVSSNDEITTIVKQEQQKRFICVRFNLNTKKGFAGEVSKLSKIWNTQSEGSSNNNTNNNNK